MLCDVFYCNCSVGHTMERISKMKKWLTASVESGKRMVAKEILAMHASHARQRGFVSCGTAF